MKPISFYSTHKKLLSDVHTPVGIYLRLRDYYRDSILLESADYASNANSFSIIAINAVAGIEITSLNEGEKKLPGKEAKPFNMGEGEAVGILEEFRQRFVGNEDATEIEKMAQGLFGYCCYDSVSLFENIQVFDEKEQPNIPLIRYRLYQYVIIINHFNDDMYVVENHFNGVESQIDSLLAKIKSRDLPSFPFQKSGDMSCNTTDEEYLQMVNKGIEACKTGEVFQIVLSRRYKQSFKGDDFNVYRALRSINPSPYLFYFDYGDYKIAGSSPEAQVICKKAVVIMHPIAGTVLKTGIERIDAEKTVALRADEKENAEHIMLVDLARNDLSRIANNVHLHKDREVQQFSHVIHLVSEVKGTIKETATAFQILAATFPAGTLSGAPKVRAMQIINELEPTPRSFYGGIIGFIGFDGSVNHAIIIRSFLSMNNTITLQAGAGVVAKSLPENELQEVQNKLQALYKAINVATEIN